jgi:hypothetical protein
VDEANSGNSRIRLWVQGGKSRIGGGLSELGQLM